MVIRCPVAAGIAAPNGAPHAMNYEKNAAAKDTIAPHLRAHHLGAAADTSRKTQCA
jgi:hypothetical protein